MKEVSDKIDKKDTENKKCNTKMATLATFIATSTVVIVASALGVKTNINRRR